ncbi:hypothetical protein BKA69DRAFT_1124822 [Paraphysoderma sedebokerense]|nr:hypothetical protein BKA69DRAFT_1124822 [Paraphysoderma sedebokerense]
MEKVDLSLGKSLQSSNVSPVVAPLKSHSASASPSKPNPPSDNVNGKRQDNNRGNKGSKNFNKNSTFQKQGRGQGQGGKRCSNKDVRKNATPYATQRPASGHKKIQDAREMIGFRTTALKAEQTQRIGLKPTQSGPGFGGGNKGANQSLSFSIQNDKSAQASRSMKSGNSGYQFSVTNKGAQSSNVTIRKPGQTYHQESSQSLRDITISISNPKASADTQQQKLPVNTSTQSQSAAQAFSINQTQTSHPPPQHPSLSVQTHVRPQTYAHTQPIQSPQTAHSILPHNHSFPQPLPPQPQPQSMQTAQPQQYYIPVQYSSQPATPAAVSTTAPEYAPVPVGSSTVMLPNGQVVPVATNMGMQVVNAPAPYSIVGAGQRVAGYVMKRIQ